MSVLEYVGMRYIPKFSDPIEWNINNTYEYFTIVQHNGDSYVSMKDVPANIDISNSEYWLRSASFNAQYETLRNLINIATNTISGQITDDIYTVNYRKCSNNVMLVITCAINTSGIKTIDLPEFLQPNIDINNSFMSVQNDNIIFAIEDNQLVINTLNGNFRTTHNLTLNYII